ncbi:MAG: type II secretion system protein [Patescibacteria group bacterium]
MRNQKGFTLIELLVSIAILMLLLTVSLVYFRKGNDSQAVRSAASSLSDAIRNAQNYAQSGVLVNGQVPSAFGVHIASVPDASNPGVVIPTAIMYADVAHGTVPANNVYDTGEEYPDSLKGTIVLDFMILKNARSNTSIGLDTDLNDGITIDGTIAVGNVDIAFTTPSAAMLINGVAVNNQVVFSLQKGTISKTVSIDRISGRVQTSF